ncbi:MAG TPA: protein translocase subunit SecF [Ktedonobacteraceae bacterium]|nr:protein translocase subunit SecF [Ktedonobacteraceae bacterium]
MFNLVGKRYLFLLISLIIIVPGTISLIAKQLNVGIDFAGGATVEMRPSTDISATDMKNLLKPLNLVNLQVLSGDNTNLAKNQVIWVRLNTQIDQNVQTNITNTLKNKYGGQTAVIFNDLALSKKITVITITFQSGTTLPSTSAIQTLLSKLPNTTDLSKPAVTPTVAPTPTVNATATAKATGTPKATATAQPKATATPTVGKGTPTPVASPTATATPTTNPAANIPVNVVDVQTGNTTHTLTILTSSEVNTDRLVAIQTAIFNARGAYTYIITNSSVSPSVASETTLRAFLAVLTASVCILLYVWFSFRKVAKPWRYGACAIIALLHDVLVVLGVFSILGWTLNIQIDTLFITAVLTVVGFSVHDTIVVFDRIRENMQRRTSETFEQVVNASLVQTMARSLNTSLTVLFTLTALTLFGGVTIRIFTLALLIGIFSGTYSSIFNASMLLVIWEKGELGLRRFNRNRTPDGREARELVHTR